MDVDLRSATTADARAVAELMAAAEAVDDVGEHSSVADVVEEMENPQIDLASDWLLAEVDGVVVARASLRPRAPVDGTLDLYVEGVVHPRWRGRGIATTLLEQMTRRAHAHAAERGLAGVLRAGALSHDAAATGLLERQGFRRSRWELVMEADLRTPTPDPAPGPAAGVPDGYTLQTWEGLDHDEIREAHNAAFGGFHPGFTPWDAPMWEQWVSGSRAFRPALSLLLRDRSGSIAAYLQSAEFEAVQEATGRREAFVAKVGTTPDHRRRGLAAVLLAQAMQRYRAEGYDVAALDVDSENPTGALGLYEGAGFVVTRRFTLFGM